MNALRLLQQQFAAHLLDGDDAVAGAVRSTPGAGAAIRLDVYAHAYRQRLHEVLADEFPALAAIAGAGTFAGWSARYGRERPSRDPNVRWYGAPFAHWLREAAPEQPAFAAMAEFEWALSTAFDAADRASLDADRLAAWPASCWPGLRLGPHPQLVLLPLAWNLDAIRRAVDHGQAPPPLASDAATLAIWRRDRQVRYRRLGNDEAIAMDALHRRLPFGELCQALAARYGSDAVPRAAQWLRDWVEAGWIDTLDDDAAAV